MNLINFVILFLNLLLIKYINSTVPPTITTETPIPTIALQTIASQTAVFIKPENKKNLNANANKSNKYLEYIFQKYGSNGIITFEGLEHLMHNLGLGGLEFEPSHTIQEHRPDGFHLPEIIEEEDDEDDHDSDTNNFIKDDNSQKDIINKNIFQILTTNDDDDDGIHNLTTSNENKNNNDNLNDDDDDDHHNNIQHIDSNNNVAAAAAAAAANEIWPEVTFKNIHDPKHRHPRHHDPHGSDGGGGGSSLTKSCLSPKSIVRLFLEKSDYEKFQMQMNTRKKRSLKKNPNSANNNNNNNNEENESLIDKNDNIQITPKSFLNMCPALLVQIDQGSCTKESIIYHDIDPIKNYIISWIYASVSIFIISLCGLMGVVIVPLTKSNDYQEILRFLVALAIGTLCGDALMHLLPHAMSPHSHNDGDSDGGHDKQQHNMPLFENGNVEMEPVWLCACAFLSTLFMYAIENLLPLLGQKSYHSHSHHSHDHHSNPPLHHHGHSHHHHHSHVHPRNAVQSNDIEKKTNVADANTFSAVPLHNVNNDQDINNRDAIQQQETDVNVTTTTTNMTNYENIRELNVMLDDSRLDKKGDLQMNADGGDDDVNSLRKKHSLSPIALMVILGDGLHNLTDGMAIGAAFAVDPVTGMATSLAVLCHELPHELGDFALLLKTGVNLRRAITFNIISSILSFIGMCIGLIVAGIHTGFVRWIYAGTAGTFLYIAFADLIPEMGRNGSTFKQMIYQIVGILLGGILMFVIAMYEDKLRILFE